jgi:hypothetical protein
MAHHDELTSTEDDYCFARPGQIYAVYLPTGGTTSLDLGDHSATFTVKWYNPRTAGELQTGTKTEIKGPGLVAIGQPPNDTDQSGNSAQASSSLTGKDWVALIKRK